MSRLVRIAPSFGHALRRSAVLLLAACLVFLGALMVEGRPARAREYHQDERARFASPATRGLIQFLGEALLTAGFAYAGRRWLRVRL